MSSTAFASVASWQYRDISAPNQVEFEPPAVTESSQELFTQEQMAARIQAALSEAKRRWDAVALERDQEREATLRKTLVSFTAERAAYFKGVEREIVQLSLGIARKILHREAGLDPTLLSGLVRIAIDRLGAETPVRVRVAPGDLSGWECSAKIADGPDALEVTVDGTLLTGECVVETSLGKADFGVEAQLREIESSFLNLLAKRPEPK